MTDTLWFFVFVQMAMGGTDTLYHHEGTQRLAWRPSQKRELQLHGWRNLAYALLFAALGWSEPRGAFAMALIALMAGELVITLWDFVEEDRSRHLPASERVLHTLLTLNYGVILALLLPWLARLSQLPTALAPMRYGWISPLCALAALGVILSGLRDLAAARRCDRLVRPDPAWLCAALPGRQAVLVTGGTGFIGERLVAALASAGHEVTVLTRNRAKALRLAEGSPIRIVTRLEEIAGGARIDAIVNLAGEPISDSPWTRAKRQRILRSRLTVTRDVLRLIGRLERKPVLVNGSAMGWYGLRGDEVLAEASDFRPCFSHEICARWEGLAIRAEALGARTVLLRTGLVLDRDGGMLARLLTPFEFGLGGRFGSGAHWMSWIHRDDMVRLIIHAMVTPGLNGPLNATAPEPVNNAGFTQALAKALHRPALIPIPAWPLRLALGDFAQELLLSGQRVVPSVALRSGFRFHYPTLDVAMQEIVGYHRAE